MKNTRDLVFKNRNENKRRSVNEKSGLLEQDQVWTLSGLVFARPVATGPVSAGPEICPSTNVKFVYFFFSQTVHS